MWRLFASSGLVKHEAPRFSTARPTYETGSEKSVIARKYSERNKTSHGGNERHPYAHRREGRRAPGGAVSRVSRIMVFVAPSVACSRRSWTPWDRAGYARLRAD